MVLAQPLPGAGSDLERIRRARLGDSDALEELITSHRTFVEQVARRFVSDHDDIDDIAQETWIRAANALGSLREEARFRPWLRAITRNACLTFLSRRQPSDSLDADDAAEPADRAADGPEASAEQRDERRRVWEALGALSELDRRALYLREVESLPFDEVARRLGVRRNAAEVRVHRARTRFRQLYEATDATQPPCGMAGIRLALLLDGELHGEPATAVEQHLTACAACTQRLRTMAQGRSLYRRMGMFALPGLAGLLDRMHRIADSLMRWIPVESVSMVAGSSSASAAVLTGVTTALVAGAILIGPVIDSLNSLGIGGSSAMPVTSVAAPPPDATLPVVAVVVDASASDVVVMRSSVTPTVVPKASAVPPPEPIEEAAPVSDTVVLVSPASDVIAPAVTPPAEASVPEDGSGQAPTDGDDSDSDEVDTDGGEDGGASGSAGGSPNARGHGRNRAGAETIVGDRRDEGGGGKPDAGDKGGGKPDAGDKGGGGKPDASHKGGKK